MLVDNNTLAERENKIDGEIVNVVRDEKMWRKMGYWYVHRSLATGIYTIAGTGTNTEQAKRIRKEVVLP